MHLRTVQILLVFFAVDLLVISVNAGDVEPEESPTKRLINGKIVDIKLAKYNVQLRDMFTNIFSGGGILIAPRYVLTAAHCVSYVGDLVVVGGASTLHDQGTSRSQIAHAFVHPKYTLEPIDWDIAVLKLERELVGENIQPISLYEKPLKVGDILQVYGWGVMQERSYRLSEQLRTIRIPVVSHKACVDTYAKVGEHVTDNMICAFKPGQMDSCQSDSGGPAVFKGKLAAVVSWGKGCGSETYPGVYTSVSAAFGFIEDCLRKYNN